MKMNGKKLLIAGVTCTLALSANINAATGGTSLVPKGDPITPIDYNYGSVNIVKVWEDGNNIDELRPDSINVTIKGSDGSTRKAEVTAANDWVYSLKGLSPDVTYTVTEDEVEGYTTEINAMTEANCYSVVASTANTQTLRVTAPCVIYQAMNVYNSNQEDGSVVTIPFATNYELYTDLTGWTNISNPTYTLAGGDFEEVYATITSEMIAQNGGAYDIVVGCRASAYKDMSLDEVGQVYDYTLDVTPVAENVITNTHKVEVKEENKDTHIDADAGSKEDEEVEIKEKEKEEVQEGNGDAITEEAKTEETEEKGIVNTGDINVFIYALGIIASVFGIKKVYKKASLKK